VDALNIPALGIFAASVLMTRRPIRVPFLAPVIFMSLGSLAATVNAANPSAAILTMVQDAYLYLWFVMLANVMQERGDFRGLRLAWVCVANVIAIIGILQVVTHGNPSLQNLITPKGFRALGTFDQPDTLSDYLVMSIFMVLSLNEEAPRALRWSSIAIMCTGIVASKANGGVGSLMVGLIAWTLVRAWTKRVSYPKLIAGALIAFSVGLVTLWLVVGLGLGSGQFSELQTNSMFGRVSHSFEGRVKIWGSLLHRYRSNPLGYGPGNSRWQTVTVEERERPLASGTDPFLSKEAHNDYLAYLIERGPLALLAMLVFKFQVFGRITRWWRSRAGSAQGWVRGGPLAAATFGAWVASWINSNTIETLHFRHVWLFLAMVYALGTMEGDARRTQPGNPARETRVSAGARTVGAG
jgi:O-antigen ligase